MRLSFLGNPAKPGIRKYLPLWIDWLLDKGHVIAISSELVSVLAPLQQDEVSICAEATSLVEGCELLISLGGDGTILSAARYVGARGIPILGVKFGGLGFLAGVAPEEFQEAFLEVQQNKVDRQQRLVLSGTLRGSEVDPRPYYALNEFVIARQQGTQSSRIALWVNETPVSTFIADGIILSSPTGATAYSMAAGGPLVSPTVDVLIITPICAHSLTTRPIVVNHDARIWVEACGESGHTLSVSADGQMLEPLRRGEMFEVKKGPYRITLLQRAGHTFFDILKTKLHWGEDIRKRWPER